MNAAGDEMPVLASRGRRLAAAAIDFALVLAAGLVLVVATGAFEDAGDYSNPLPRIIGFGFVAYFLVNGWHLARYSQTLGKAILGLVVVDAATTNPAEWWRLAIRSPFFLALYSVSLGALVLLPLVDQAFIFRGNRRCLHDLICGTDVLRLSRTRADTT